MTNYARCRSEIKFRIAMAKATYNKMTVLTSKLDSNIRNKLVKCYIWNIALCGAGIWTHWKADQKYI
jgi:hypothetical protein